MRTPPLEDLHEEFPITDEEISLAPGTKTGAAEFWRSVYSTVRTAAPFPFTIEESIEAVKFAQLVKKNSPFAM